MIVAWWLGVGGDMIRHSGKLLRGGWLVGREASNGCCCRVQSIPDVIRFFEKGSTIENRTRNTLVARKAHEMKHITVLSPWGAMLLSSQSEETLLWSSRIIKELAW